jgi:G3E family GTPase
MSVWHSLLGCHNHDHRQNIAGCAVLCIRVNADWDCRVVDAKHIMQHLDEQKPEGVENESVEQLAFADKVLLNKVRS